MKAILLASCIALLAAPSALAKGRIVVRLGDSTPAVRQPFTIYVRTDYVVPADDWLPLFAAPPGSDWWDAVTSNAGFEIKLRRTGTHTWRAVVRLPRAGRWRLVLANGTHRGYMVPPPTAWMPWVRVHA